MYPQHACVLVNFLSLLLLFYVFTSSVKTMLELFELLLLILPLLLILLLLTQPPLSPPPPKRSQTNVFSGRLSVRPTLLILNGVSYKQINSKIFSLSETPRKLGYEGNPLFVETPQPAQLRGCGKTYYRKVHC